MLYSCFNPKVVRNVYTGEDFVCRCGKCPACLNIRSSQWVQRLDIESQLHKYTLFCTLTYDDLHVPQIVRLRKDNYPNAAYYNSDNHELIDCRDINKTFTKKDWQFISDSKVINVLDKKDIQLFIKLLRYYVTKEEKSAKIRYYYCAEYGPRTYRPHGHLLLFFDSERIKEKIGELLSKSWSFGYIYDPHIVSGSAAEYCASYINQFSYLPSLFYHKSLRPFTLFSKQIGLPIKQKYTEGIREIFFRRDDKFTVRSLGNFEFVDVPFWRSLQNRLYPRLAGFDYISHSDRVKIYRTVQRIYEAVSQECSEGFQQQKRYSISREVSKEIQRTIIFSEGNDWICRYFRKISSKFVVKSRFLKNEVSFNGFKDLPFLPFDFKIDRQFKMAKFQDQEFNFDALCGHVARIIRSLRDCYSFGCTIEEYVTNIEKYYDTKSDIILNGYYEYQKDYFKSHPVWHLIYFDYKFLHTITSVQYDCLTIFTRKMLLYLFNGCVPLKDGMVVIPPLESNQEFQNMRIHYLCMSHNKTKTKECNDYALARKDKFGNIINFQNL